MKEINNKPYFIALLIAFTLYLILVLTACTTDDMEDNMTCEEKNALVNSMADDQYSRWDKVSKGEMKRIESWREEHLIDCDK